MNKFIALAAVALLSACASGKPMKESKEAAAPIPAGKGRIVVYRNSVMGAAIQPTVSVNGATTGKCSPRGAFSVDVPPGNSVLRATTEATKEALAHVAPGETAFVRCGIGIGIMVGRPTLETVPPATGKKESADLAFTGRF